MTLRLIVIRHAKSDWGDPALDDHDRTLNDRGRRSAPRIGAWLAREGYVPSQVFCSTARRTQETWAGIAAELPGQADLLLSRALYHASAADYLATVHGAAAPTVALVGHNPGIGSLAISLAETPPAHDRFGLYPTGATTVLEFDAERWADITPGTGRVVAFAVPRDLPDP